MKVDLVQILFIVPALVLTGAVQDMLPAFAGVKVPLLLAIALAMACAEFLSAPARWGAAVFGGCMAGSLGMLPLACAELFFMAAGAAAGAVLREGEYRENFITGFCTLAVAAPLMEVWLYLWGVAGTDAAVSARALPALALGAPAGGIAFAVMPWIGEHIGLAAVREDGE